MPRWRMILLFVCSVIVLGCVAVRQAPLPESESSRFVGRTLHRSVYAKPAFAAYTAGKAGFGLIGAVSIIQAGNEIVSKYAVEDPAVRIGQEAAKRSWSDTACSSPHLSRQCPSPTTSGRSCRHTGTPI